MFLELFYMSESEFPAAILENSSLDVVGSPFKQLKWSHYLLIIRSLETGSSSKTLHGSTHTITCSFTMGCCTEVPFSFNTKIFAVFVL